jgi:hypothetical protein
VTQERAATDNRGLDAEHRSSFGGHQLKRAAARTYALGTLSRVVAASLRRQRGGTWIGSVVAPGARDEIAHPPAREISVDPDRNNVDGIAPDHHGLDDAA